MRQNTPAGRGRRKRKYFVVIIPEDTFSAVLSRWGNSHVLGFDPQSLSCVLDRTTQPHPCTEDTPSHSHTHARTHARTHALARAHTHTLTHILTHTHTHTHTHTQTHTHTHTHTHRYRHAQTHARTDAQRHTHTHTHTDTDMLRHTHTQTYKDTYIHNTHTHTHTHTTSPPPSGPMLNCPPPQSRVGKRPHLLLLSLLIPALYSRGYPYPLPPTPAMY